MRRLSSVSLARVFALLIAVISITFVQAANYRVVTASTLNVRSAPSTNSGKIFSLSNGEIVNVVEKGSDGWMKIEINGSTGYVFGKYLEVVPEAPSSVSHSKEKFWSLDTRFWVHFIIFIALTIAFFFLSEEHGLIAMLCNTGAAFCVWKYTDTGFGDSFWFLDFEKNGFFLYLFFVFLIFIFMTWAFTMFWEHLCMILGLFSAPLIAIIGLITALFWLMAIKELVFDFFQYHTLMAILILFSSVSSSRQFVGVFTDRNGNKWDVYKE